MHQSLTNILKQYQQQIRRFDINSFVFEDTPGAYHLSDENVIVSFISDDIENCYYTEFITSSNSEPVRIDNAEQILRIQYHDGCCYMIGANSVMMMDTNGKEPVVLDNNLTQLKKLLFLPNGKLMGCFSEKSQTIEIYEN